MDRNNRIFERVKDSLKQNNKNLSPEDLEVVKCLSRIRLLAIRLFWSPDKALDYENRRKIHIHPQRTRGRHRSGSSRVRSETMGSRTV